MENVIPLCTSALQTELLEGSNPRTVQARPPVLIQVSLCGSADPGAQTKAPLRHAEWGSTPIE